MDKSNPAEQPTTTSTQVMPVPEIVALPKTKTEKLPVSTVETIEKITQPLQKVLPKEPPKPTAQAPVAKFLPVPASEARPAIPAPKAPAPKEQPSAAEILYSRPGTVPTMPTPEAIASQSRQPSAAEMLYSSAATASSAQKAEPPSLSIAAAPLSPSGITTKETIPEIPAPVFWGELRVTSYNNRR